MLQTDSDKTAGGRSARSGGAWSQFPRFLHAEVLPMGRRLPNSISRPAAGRRPSGPTTSGALKLCFCLTPLRERFPRPSAFRSVRALVGPAGVPVNNFTSFFSRVLPRFCSVAFAVSGSGGACFPALSTQLLFAWELNLQKKNVEKNRRTFLLLSTLSCAFARGNEPLDFCQIKQTLEAS